jgi:FHA domain-containing protein
MSPRLIPLTDDARCAINNDQCVVERFPFRVGRERRTFHLKVPDPAERRFHRQEPTNDLYIVDICGLFKFPASHFQIEAQSGDYFLTDLGTPCGTIVEGKTLGGNDVGGRTQLHDHDVIILGSALSPMIFKFRTN